MSRKLFLSLCMVVLLSVLVSCTPRRVTSTPKAGLPNPASVYCEDQCGKLDIRTDDTGGQVGMCVFPDGSECEEWAYYRGQCAPNAESTVTP